MKIVGQFLPVNCKDTYVYLHVFPNKTSYIGMGSLMRVFDYKYREPEYKKCLEECLGEFEVVILAMYKTRAEAFARETLELERKAVSGGYPLLNFMHNDVHPKRMAQQQAKNLREAPKLIAKLEAIRRAQVARATVYPGDRE